MQYVSCKNGISVRKERREYLYDQGAVIVALQLSLSVRLHATSIQSIFSMHAKLEALSNCLQSSEPSCAGEQSGQSATQPGSAAAAAAVPAVMP